MGRDGIGLLEVILGMLILTVGVLALAASTTFVQVQLWSADLRTERQAARQQVVEELQAIPFDSVAAVAQADAVSRGGYSIWWDASSLQWALKEVQVYTQGPAVVNGQRRLSVRDTVTVRIARRIQ